MTVKDGMLIFTFNSENLFSKLIYATLSFFNKKLRMPLSHVGIFSTPHFVYEFAAPAGMSISMLEKYRAKKFALYFARVTAEFNVEQAFRYARGERGKKYSYWQIIAILLQKVFKLNRVGDWSRQGQMCSEFVVNFYRAGGLDLFPGKDASEITPGDLFLHDQIEFLRVTSQF